MALGQLENLARSKQKKDNTCGIDKTESESLLAQLNGWQLQVVSLLYGTEMRLMECLTLRVKDIDFDYGRIHVCQTMSHRWSMSSAAHGRGR